MAKGIRDLTRISEDGGKLEPENLFECVTAFLDSAGIYARKVRADEIEAFIARDGGVVKTLIELIADALEARKANKYAAAGMLRLMDAQIGANITGILFDTGTSPVMLDSVIRCAGGSFRVENGVFYFHPSDSPDHVIFYRDGAWTAEASGVFYADNLIVQESVNANGGVWESRYGSQVMDLVTVRNDLYNGIVAERERARQELADHNTSAAAHQNIRALMPPSLPGVSGDYYLRMTAGVPSWHGVGT